MIKEQLAAEAIKCTLKSLVAEITERKTDEISDTDHFVDDLEIDSLMALEMMVAVNKKFRIQLFEQEFGTITNVNGAVAVIQRHLALAAAENE